MKNSITIQLLLLVFVTNSILFSCEKLIEIDDPKGEIPSEIVYENTQTATAAITQLYANLRDEYLVSGNLYGASTLMGFYADELDYYALATNPVNDYVEHRILSSNTINSSIWSSGYQLIYMCNVALERLENSKNLSNETKNQLKGEALFIRAFVHFYLSNYYGEIPYIKTSQYLQNVKVSRQSTLDIYNQLKDDLKQAQVFLKNEYPTSERIRANYFTVTALLARVELYHKNWKDAEEWSNKIINTASMYYLEDDLSKEFLKESHSAILQLKPKKIGDPTNESKQFIFEVGPPPTMALSQKLVDEFESKDLRKQIWIKQINKGTDYWYMPYKYKQNTIKSESTEYAILFRLAEQILIRAEARIMQGNITGALQDINTIRNRAGLTNTTAVNSVAIMDEILKERRLELFTEHGHRWFDIKRLNKAEITLQPLKPGWKSTDILFPIPETEIRMNPNLLPQNNGY